jgi:flagellar basal body-associated protein FliL
MDSKRLLILVVAVIIVAGAVWYLAPMGGTESTATAPEASAPAATTPASAPAETTPAATPETPATTTP